MIWKLHGLFNIFRIMKSMILKWPNMQVCSVHVWDEKFVHYFSRKSWQKGSRSYDSII